MILDAGQLVSLLFVGVGVYFIAGSIWPEIQGPKGWHFSPSGSNRSIRASRVTVAFMGTTAVLLGLVAFLQDQKLDIWDSVSPYLFGGTILSFVLMFASGYWDSLAVRDVATSAEPVPPQPKIPDPQNPSQEI